MPAALKAALHSLLPKPYSMEASTAFQKRASAFSTSSKFISPRSNFAWAASRSAPILTRSEEHTSELQSRPHLVCRLLLEKKKKKNNKHAESTNNNLGSQC